MTDPRLDIVSSTLISVDNLTKVYGLFKKFRALDGVTLTVRKGEIFGLIGPNGAGKTTLMGCLLGLLRPSSGSILIDGKSVHDLRIKAVTGFVPERPHFDAWMTCAEFLHYHHMLAKRPDSEAKKAVSEALAKVGLEPEVAKRTVSKLSRGMLQRLGLAQLLVGQPKLCFLDEPTSGMDPLGMSLVRNLLLEWKANGATVIINSHHLDQVERVCDRVAFIQKGKIDTIEELSQAQATRHAFTVRWGAPHPESSLVEQAARESNVDIEFIAEDSARFFLTSRSQASELLEALLKLKVPVEEASFERKALVELFTKASTESKVG